MYSVFILFLTKLNNNFLYIFLLIEKYYFPLLHLIDKSDYFLMLFQLFCLITEEYKWSYVNFIRNSALLNVKFNYKLLFVRCVTIWPAFSVPFLLTYKHNRNIIAAKIFNCLNMFQNLKYLYCPAITNCSDYTRSYQKTMFYTTFRVPLSIVSRKI